MLNFVAIGPEMPEKRSAENRLADLGEIYGDYVREGAARPASRYSQSGVPTSALAALRRMTAVNQEQYAVTGGCLCWAVRFTIIDGPQATSICHCDMCRRWTGGPMMAVHPKTPLRLDKSEALAWYGSSEWAERGFCSACGTVMFYRLRQAPDDLMPTAGTLDDPAAISGIERHIFVEEKPDYYEFADDTPRLTGEEAIAAFNAGQGDG